MSALRRRVTHPSRSDVRLVLLLLLDGTRVLPRPASVIDAQAADWLPALFAAVSAVCVTDLVVGTDTYRSPVDQTVVPSLLQRGSTVPT